MELTKYNKLLPQKQLNFKVALFDIKCFISKIHSSRKYYLVINAKGCIMGSKVFYLFTADIILFVHALFVMFLVFGLLLIFAGKLFSWSWVRNPWFRLAHLIGIFIVILQSWIGLICPLTTWEMVLRSKAGDTLYAGSFVSYWLKRLLYYQAPEWVFIFCYTAFGLLVVVSWFWVYPRFSNINRTH